MRNLVRPRWGGLQHPTALALTSAVALAGSYAVAVQRPVPSWELSLTEWINGAPDAVATVLCDWGVAPDPRRVHAHVRRAAVRQPRRRGVSGDAEERSSDALQSCRFGGQ